MGFDAQLDPLMHPSYPFGQILPLPANLTHLKEVLKIGRPCPENTRMQYLTVVVLTTSNQSSDIQKMYKLRCSCFITKPVDFDSFTKLIAELTGYWLTVVKLPEQPGTSLTRLTASAVSGGP